LELTDFFGHIIDEVSMSYQNGVHFDLQLVGDFTGRYDEWLLREIFGNLISNAVKYSHPNGLVEIYGTRQAETFTVTIRDHGIGIAEEDQSHLFEAFYRAANARHISGTGLGLVIVKQAVDAYGGTISFESQEGVGTTFTVQLLFHPLDEG
jgi:signal transduction histidine kinase